MLCVQAGLNRKTTIAITKIHRSHLVDIEWLEPLHWWKRRWFRRRLLCRRCLPMIMIFFMVGAPIAVHLLLVCWRLCLWLLKILVWHFQGGEIIRWRDYLLVWARFFSFLAQRNGLDRVDLSDQWKPKIGNRCWWAKQVRTANGNTCMHARCFFHGVPRSTRIWRQCRTTEDPAIFIKAKALFKWSAVIRKDLASSCSAEYTPAKISYTRRHPERTTICQGAAPI